MAQLSLYINDEISRRLDEAASAEGISRSALARRALEKELGERRQFSAAFFSLLGTYKDAREPAEILAEIRAADYVKLRDPLD